MPRGRGGQLRRADARAIIAALRILHAIHDFLPRHRAGSEIYAAELCGALARRHFVTVLCADFDLTQPHGAVRWRAHDGLPVAEIVNNWVCRSFEETYLPPLVGSRIEHVLRATEPDVVHVHNLLNLSFDLPSLARARGIPVVATLHDYTLVCPSGGQRIHRAEEHVCERIDVDRCARCFRESPFQTQVAAGRASSAAMRSGRLGRATLQLLRRLPAASRRMAESVSREALVVTASDIERRMGAARAVFEAVDLFVAPSRALADRFVELGVDRRRITVEDYGMKTLSVTRAQYEGPLRIGFVGSIVWHKGVHVLIDAVRQLPAGSWELKIFGDPAVAPDYVADLRSRSASLPVRFMGPIGPDHASDAYAQIDVLAVPSLWLENSPLVIHEAFMAGVPVAAARIGGIPDLVTDGVNGRLYDPTSAADLARVLRELLDPEVRRALARQAPAVKTIEDDARWWEEMYANAARGRARQPA